jgi:hypothetical protein
MLPDLRFLICGVLFCFLLFAVTGAGVRLPDARTRVGETPEIGRPMMQRSIAETPAPARFYMMAAARRTDELERLREQPASVEDASVPEKTELAASGTEKPGKEKPEADTDSGLPKPAIVASLAVASPAVASPAVASPAVASPAVASPAVASPAPGAAPPENMASGSVMAEDAEAPVQATRVEIVRQDRAGDAAGQRIAALAPAESGPSVAEGGEPAAPRFVNVPLPSPRPAFFGFHRRVHLFHRRHRVVVVQRDIPAASAPAASLPAPGAPAQAVSAVSVQPAPAQGAVVQGWPAAGAPAATAAPESGRR